jgi:glycosyltransferase involved in cell wall biosynthesis
VAKEPETYPVRLIILNQFFYPDHSATSQLMTDLAESLVARGVEVTAVAGRGRYNGGETLPPREDFRGVKIERAWATGFGKGNVFGRLSDYLTFYLGAALKLFTLPRHNIVMALTTPPLIGLLALSVCRLRGMKLVALVQDIYPDVAVALGALKPDSFATRAFDRLNRLVLRRADRVVALGECMREVIVEKVGDARGRVDVIHNWADGEKIMPLAEGERNEFAAGHDLGDRFVVLFSGNFGRVNDFATPLAAARILRERADILFLFVGDGAKAGEIEEFVGAHDLRNVRILPYQPRERLRQSLAAGSVHLVTLAPGLAGLSVPSKTYGIFAAARPVIFVGDPRSDAARLVAENGCGEIVSTGDSERLAAVVVCLAKDRELAAEMGRRARALFERRFERAHAVDAYIESFRKCLGDEADLGDSSEIVTVNQRN